MKASIIGLGYVGLPVAIRLNEIGLDVVGIDINSNKIKSLKHGTLPFAQKEPYLLLRFNKSIKRGKLKFADDFENIKDSKIVFITIDTPLKNGRPNTEHLKKAIVSVGKNLSKETIVVIESTVAPGTIQNLVIPTLEEESGLQINKDFYVAVAPERIRPNFIFVQLTTFPRVIGISHQKIKKTLQNVYSKITQGDIDITDIKTAEALKTIENTYRDVNIAFANEMAIACEELGVDIWQIRKLINKAPYRDILAPGPGVGGHCIPKDPLLLISSVKSDLNMTALARKINNSMPNHLYNLLKKTLSSNNIKKSKAKIAILGYSFVENTDDTRDSPTEVFSKILRKNGIRFEIHDPHVYKYSKDIHKVLEGVDCIVVMVRHLEYKKLDLKRISENVRTKIFIDARNLLDKKRIERHGFTYKAIGNV